MRIDPAQIPFFRAMPETQRQEAFGIFQTSTVPAGRQLIVEGEVGDTMYILVKGQVKIVKSMIVKDLSQAIPTLEKPEKVLAVLTDETFPMFGELALLDQDTRSATVEVLTDCTFLEANRKTFTRFLEDRPAAGACILLGIGRRLARTVRRNNQAIVKLTTALALLLNQSSTR